MEMGGDVVGVAETWLANNELHERLAQIKGYTFSAGMEYIGKDGMPYRGVAMYVKDGLEFVTLPGDDSPCLHSICVKTGEEGGRDLYVAVFYSSSSAPLKERIRDFQVLLQWYRRWWGKGVMFVMGDFNGEGVGGDLMRDWILESGMVCLNSLSRSDSNHNSIQQQQQQQQLQQQQQQRQQQQQQQQQERAVCPSWSSDLMEPTSSSGNVLDCMFACPELEPACGPLLVWKDLGVGGSPHFPIFVQINWEAKIVPMHRQEGVRWKDVWKKEVQAKYTAGSTTALSNLATGTLESTADIEGAVREFTACVLNLAYEEVGTVPVQRGSRPWFDKELAECVRKRQAVMQLATRRGREGRHAEAVKLRAEGMVMKDAVRKAARMARKKQEERACNQLLSIDTRQLWMRVRAASTSKSCFPRSMREVDGSLVSEPEKVLRVQKEFMAALCDEDQFWSEGWSEKEWSDMKQRAAVSMPEGATGKGEGANEVTVPLVKRAVRKLQNMKAPGIDGVTPWMLRLADCDLMAAVLQRLFAAMWRLCYIPDEWKRSLVVPIFKKGDRCDPDCYRPISLLCVPAKVMSRLINDVLYERLETAGVLADEQGGFMKSRGCPEMVLGLYSLCEGRKRRGDRTFLAFVDVRKAYDTVQRAGLALRLLELGTPEHIWAMVRSMYTGDSACIAAGGLRSAWFNTTLGVKQGDVSSPILYSCFINAIVPKLDSMVENHGVDLYDQRKRLSILLYADDMVLLAESSEALQHMLDVLTTFAKDNFFKLSSGPDQSKSVVMVYGDAVQSCPARASDFRLCGAFLPMVAEYTYLGVVFHCMGEWSSHLKAIERCVQGQMAILRRAGLSKSGLPVWMARTLVWAEVCTQWEYACGAILFLPDQVKQLVVLFNAAVRLAAGVREFVSVEPLLFDLDLIEAQPQFRLMSYRVGLWRKVMSMKQDRWVRRAVALWESVPALLRTGPRYKEAAAYDLPTSNWLLQVATDLNSLQLPHLLRDPALAVAMPSGAWKVLVKEAVFTKRSQPAWRIQLNRCAHLVPFNAFVKGVQFVSRTFLVENDDGALVEVHVRRKSKTFCPLLHLMHRKLCSFLLTLRAGCLPVQHPINEHLQFYRCGGTDASPVCFMCNAGADESLRHFMFECPAYAEIQKVCAPWPGFTLGELLSAPDRFLPQTVVLFKMWSVRMQKWRHSDACALHLKVRLDAQVARRAEKRPADKGKRWNHPTVHFI